MKLHSNATLTPTGRLSLVHAVKQDEMTLNAAAAAFKVITVTARKCVQRFGVEGAVGLQDRSSRPARLRAPIPPKVIRRIERLRRQRMAGARIAKLTGVSTTTVSRVLKRLPEISTSERSQNGEGIRTVKNQRRPWFPGREHFSRLVQAFESASGKPIPYVLGPCRDGEIAECYANASLAKWVLGWQAELSIERACAEGRRWQQRNPGGYRH